MAPLKQFSRDSTSNWCSPDVSKTKVMNDLLMISQGSIKVKNDHLHNWQVSDKQKPNSTCNFGAWWSEKTEYQVWPSKLPSRMVYLYTVVPNVGQ